MPREPGPSVTARTQALIKRYPPGLVDLNVEPDFRDRLLQALEHLDSGGRLRDLIHWEAGNVSAETTWHQLFLEFLQRVGRPSGPSSGAPERKAAMCSLLASILSLDSAEARWSRAVELVLSEADLLSGWAHSFYKDWHAREPVEFSDGRYFLERDGQTIEVNGRRTELEERWDFFAAACERAYGAIHPLLRLLALLEICEAHRDGSEDFHPSVEIVLPQSDQSPAFEAWSWRIRWPYETRLPRWRPKSPFMDPDWLAADLVAAFASHEEIPDRELLPPEWTGSESEWRERSAGFPGQMEFSVSSGLRFTDQEEVWFDFRGRPYRWINETPTMKGALVVPVRNRNDDRGDYEESLRFISHLAFSTDRAISTELALSGASRYAPMLAQPRRSGGLHYPQLPRIRTEDVEAEKLDRALALYREGLNSGSVFYSFLSFYKVIQWIFDESSSRIETWILENFDAGNDWWLSERGIRADEATDYLFRSGRCAIAHVADQPSVDPDDPIDYRRISRDVRVVRGLAKQAIEGVLLARPSEKASPRRRR